MTVIRQAHIVHAVTQMLDSHARKELVYLSNHREYQVGETRRLDKIFIDHVNVCVKTKHNGNESELYIQACANGSLATFEEIMAKFLYAHGNALVSVLCAGNGATVAVFNAHWCMTWAKTYVPVIATRQNVVDFEGFLKQLLVAVDGQAFDVTAYDTSLPPAVVSLALGDAGAPNSVEPLVLPTYIIVAPDEHDPQWQHFLEERLGVLSYGRINAYKRGDGTYSVKAPD
jgi:hypothetical protein